MIGSIAAAGAALQLASANFDASASALVATTSPDGSGDVGDIADALAGMDVAKFAFLASLHAARTSNDMVAEMIKSFDPR